MTFYSTRTISNVSNTIATRIDLETQIYVQSEFNGFWQVDTDYLWSSVSGESGIHALTSLDDIDQIMIQSGGGWDVTTATYDGTSFSVSSQEASVRGIFFKPDGSKMYIIGSDGDEVNPYTLSTPWDVTTATYDGVPFSVSPQDLTPADIHFSPDGTKMYIVGDVGDDVNPYTLSTPWDVTTATYDGTSFSVNSQETAPSGLFFKPDGTKMYVLGDTGNDVNPYTLSTPWDVTTATFDGTSFSVNSQETSPMGLFFKPDGTKMYVAGDAGNDINPYTLSTPWDVTTATYDGTSFSVNSQETNPAGIFFKPDGTKMYVVGISGNEVDPYTLGIATATTASSGSMLVGSSLCHTGANLTLMVRLKLNQVSNVAIFAGITDSTSLEHPMYLSDGTNTITGDATNACGFGFDTQGTTAQWFIGGIKAGAATSPTFTGSPPVADVHNTLKIVIDASGNMTGYIDNILVGTVNNAITPSTSITPCIMILTRDETSHKIGTIDFINITQPRE